MTVAATATLDFNDDSSADNKPQRTRALAQAMLDFIVDGAGITLGPSPPDDKDTDKDRGGDNDGAKKNGDRESLGGLLKLDPGLLEILLKKGTEALVVAFVEGGDVDSIPGWGDATKGLQGQVRAEFSHILLLLPVSNRYFLLLLSQEKFVGRGRRGLCVLQSCCFSFFFSSHFFFLSC